MSSVYCTISQLTTLYDVRVVNELSDDTASNSVSTANIQLALDSAADELDSYFANRIVVPISPVPALLTRLCGALAMRNMYARRTDSPAGVKSDIDWAQGWLDKYIMGVVSLPNTSRAAPTLAASGATDGSSRFDNLPLQDTSGNTASSVNHGNSGVLSAPPGGL